MIQLVPITSLYASLCAVLIIGLAFNVVAQRRGNKVGLGDKGKEPLTLAIRTHANAIEYVPIGLLLILILELNGARSAMLHGLGSALLIGRVLHAWGLSHSAGTSFGRYYGTLITWLVILGAAAINLIFVIESF
jgi:uncharacterized membrane protein YecN with MAPEG domain